MFRQNCYRNSFLVKSCNKLSRNSLHGTMNEVFFRHFEASETSRGKETVEYFEDFENSAHAGYKKFGLEDLVSTPDLIFVRCSERVKIVRRHQLRKFSFRLRISHAMS